MLKNLERETGIEPATNSLEGCDSTTELLPPFTSTAAPIRKVRSQSKTSQHRQSHCPRRLHRRIIQRPPCRNSQHDEQKHREKKTAHARSLLIKPNRNNGAQGRIRTSVARKERQIYSLLPLTTRPPVRNSAAHSTSKTAFHAKQQNSQAHSNALHSPLGKFQNSCSRIAVRAAVTLSSPTGEIWSWRRDLNPRPSDYKSDALPAELRQPARSPWRGLKRTTSFELPDARDNF